MPALYLYWEEMGIKCQHKIHLCRGIALHPELTMLTDFVIQSEKFLGYDLLCQMATPHIKNNISTDEFTTHSCLIIGKACVEHNDLGLAFFLAQSRHGD